MRFVGRQGAVETVSRWLREREDVRESKLRLASIYGPGGIGKTFLVSYALQEQRSLLQERYLVIRLSGQTAGLDLLHLWTTLWLQEAAKDTQGGRWPALRAIEEARNVILGQMEASILRQQKELPEMRGAFEALLEVGLRPQEALALRPFDLRLAEIAPETLEEAIRLLHDLPGWRRERQWLFGLRWFQKGRILRNQLRSHLEETLAGALISDLRLHIPPPPRASRTPSPPSSSPRSLLLILDDYESLHPLTGNFLVETWLPKLDAIGLPVFLLVVGRDNLLTTHPDWGQHFRSHLGERLLEVKPFERWEAFEMMRQNGIHASDVCEKIWGRTQGFPFLLDLESEDARSGGPSALHLKLFLDRLTRWMTPIQRSWLVPLCFLEEINLETIRRVLPKADSSVVLQWFQSEPSIRDPSSSRWQILAFVRERVQMAVRNDSPQAYQAWLEKSQTPSSASETSVLSNSRKP